MDIKKEEQILKDEIKNIFNSIQELTKDIPDNLNEQVGRLFQLRSEVYEELNQLQHKSLILKVAKLLKKEFPEINRWTWHPKQTSNPDEADLTCYKDSIVIISAEVTTSMKPVGTIDTRMRNTLNSLNRKNGKLFYFVQTTEMFNRATTKIIKNNWDITPRLVRLWQA
jgi:hypothetical protein